jgi:hypothetical protein
LTAIDDERRLQTSIHVDMGGDVTSETIDPVALRHVRQMADRLAHELAGTFPQETIERYLAESLDLLGETRIDVFVPVLARRVARERPPALAQAEGW